MQTALEVPFYSQHWDLDRWSDLGFESRKDAEYWMWSSCGVLALKSAIDAGNRRAGQPDSPLIWQYIRDGVALQAYTHERGWVHAGLVALAEKYGARAVALQRQRTSDVRRLLELDMLVIASVRPGLEPRTSLLERLVPRLRSGGHLVLVTGLQGGVTVNDPDDFVVNHPSARAHRNWEGKRISMRSFAQTFTGSAIAVSLKR